MIEHVKKPYNFKKLSDKEKHKHVFKELLKQPSMDKLMKSLATK